MVDNMPNKHISQNLIFSLNVFPSLISIYQWEIRSNHTLTLILFSIVGLTAKEGLIGTYQGLIWDSVATGLTDPGLQLYTTISLFRLCLDYWPHLPSVRSQCHPSGMAMWIQTRRPVRSFVVLSEDSWCIKMTVVTTTLRLRPNGLKITSYQSFASTHCFLDSTCGVPDKLKLYWTETLQCETRLAQEEFYAWIWEHHQWPVYMCTSSKTCRIRYRSSNRTDV